VGVTRPQGQKVAAFADEYILDAHSKELKAIFAPLITDILRLIDDQVKSVQIKRPGGGVTVGHPPLLWLKT